MKIKSVITSIWNHNLNLQERMFRLFVLLGLSGFGIGLVGGFLSGGSILNTIPLIFVFLLIFGITYFTLKYNKIQLGAVLIAIVVLYVLLPFNFITAGGIYSGGPVWFLLGIVYVCLNVNGRIKYVMLVSAFIVDAGCYYIAYAYPDKIIQNTVDVAYKDSIVTLCVVGGVICVMILFQNSIYRMENRITKEQKKEIEELNKVQNRFFSTMSHEIRTPINTIIGLNEMILREDVSDEVAADAKSIQGASKMLLTLINDILDMSKIESGKMQIVQTAYDMGSMLSDIVNMIWVRAKDKGLEFHVNVDEKISAQLYGDEGRIKQVLINLLNNAVKYTEKGSVTLSIQCKKKEDGIEYISYSVSDTGMGIEKEDIPYLFSAFKRVDEEKNRHIEGTGLGLAIVKQLVELMNGDIAVNSIYTKGSTFVVILPQKVVGDEQIGNINIEARHSLNARSHYRQSFEAPGARVLVVDDNEMNLMVAEKLLRATKIHIDTVTSGKECLAMTLQNKYDVILMDHMMPEMDGIECMHEIRVQTGGQNLRTPIVVLTANAGGENRALYEREGFDGYLLKPVTGDQLEKELIRHLPRQLVRVIRSENSGTIEQPAFERRQKVPIMISTDSVCDLPKELIQKYRIAVLPYRVCAEGGEFLDGIEVETEGILNYIGERGKKAYSREPRLEDYKDFFADNLTKAQHIIHITMARKASKGYETALEAKETFDNVTVIDSGHLSSGMGLIVLRAAELALSGRAAVKDIVNTVVDMRKRVNTNFIVDSTEYLARSGRLSERMNKMCKSLMLHPVLAMKKDNIVVSGINIGTRERVWDKYIRRTLKDTGSINQGILFITYVKLGKEELSEIEQLVSNTIKFKKIIFQKATSAISVNCGPGSFGLIFVRNSKWSDDIS